MRVVNSQLDPRRDQSDVRGEHTVVYPVSSQEVVQALHLSEKCLGVKPLIRSGLHAAHDEKVEGEGIVVIQMRDLDDILVNGEVVTVGVGATTEELASHLVKEKLYLPLDPNPDRSIVSNAMSTDQGYLGRSTGLLSEFITTIKYVTANGEFSTTAFHHLPPDSVVTHVVFKAKTSDEMKDLVMIPKALPYVKDEFRKLLDGLFVNDTRLLSASRFDLTVRVFTGAFGVPTVSVTAACFDAGTLKGTMRPIMKKIGGSGASLYSAFVFGEETTTGVAVVNTIAEDGNASTLRYEESRRHYASEEKPGKSLIAFLKQYCKHVEKAVGVATPSVSIASAIRLQDKVVARKGGGCARKVMVGVTASFHMRITVETREERNLRRAISVDMQPVPFVGPPTKPDSVRNERAIAFAGFATGAKTSGIVGCMGEVVLKGDPIYERKREQYATSSYPAFERMKPSMVVYPLDTADVIAIVNYAVKRNKKVVARSGGHQYCGMSSGGDSTILISMELMNKVSPPTDNVITVGPGAILTNLSKELLQNKLSIPHGECPRVAIGGHVQTGGFGHTLRSFGLALDYVKSFEIVLVDSKGQVSSRTITRPTSVNRNVRSAENLNNRIYWGVLGGGPGTFGIITNVEFECIRDSDHPNSVGYSAVYKYRKNTFASCMAIVKGYTERIESGNLPADYDLMISAMSSLPGTARFFDCIVVEMLHGNLRGDNEKVSPNVFDQHINNISSKEKIETFKGRQPLSFMADAWVRNIGMTKDGREFSYPYKKRVNATKRPLTEEFVVGFVKLVDESINFSSGIKIVFQMVLGGGAYRDNGNCGITSIPHRDTVIGIVYDVFYRPEFKEKAEALQKEMQALLREFQDYDEDDPKGIRMIWGSFGEEDELDMNNVWKNYYGKVGPYKDLQELKEDADPLDIFSNSFTVQMPRGEKRPHGA